MALDSGFDDRTARVEMIPLLDVVFLLLVYFIYAIFAMTVHRGLKVDLPRAAGVVTSGQQIIITISADDDLQLDGKPLSFEEIVDCVVAVWHKEELPVLISADRQASLGQGIELLARLKNGGVHAVAFQVEGTAHDSSNRDVDGEAIQSGNKQKRELTTSVKTDAEF